VAKQSANGLASVLMLIEVQLRREMSKLVRRHHDTGLPRDKVADLMAKTTAWTTSAIFTRE
jgi:hypothetical protein